MRASAIQSALSQLGWSSLGLIDTCYAASTNNNQKLYPTMDELERLSVAFADLVWGPPLVALLLGGGLFFAGYSRLLPYRHFGHAIGLVLGRNATDDQPGELSHGQALAAALSGTMGLGNISGVALAIVAGGPGAIFWMWMSALVGVATKFFTCSLGVMYRGEDSLGRLQGGPMYIIREALPRKFYPLAILFSAAGLVGHSFSRPLGAGMAGTNSDGSSRGKDGSSTLRPPRSGTVAWPSSSSPNPTTLPSSSRAREWVLPAATCTALRPPRSGAVAWPKPSWPNPTMLPSSSSARE